MSRMSKVRVSLHRIPHSFQRRFGPSNHHCAGQKRTHPPTVAVVVIPELAAVTVEFLKDVPDMLGLFVCWLQTCGRSRP